MAALVGSVLELEFRCEGDDRGRVGSWMNSINSSGAARGNGGKLAVT